MYRHTQLPASHKSVQCIARVIKGFYYGCKVELVDGVCRQRDCLS